MNFPDDTQRLAIVGATGSGKTYAAMWHLSRRSYDRMPWIIYDFKGDRLINSIPGAYHIRLDQPLPTRPGVYIVHPHPGQTETGEVESHMWAIWEMENTGVYIDEGYMVGNNNSAFRAMLTQGRSKRIPMIVLSQRPVWMDRFVFSESEFFQIFRLQHSDDLKSVQKFIPSDIKKRLPEYNSYYYDVNANKTFHLTPVPDGDNIISTFDRRLRQLRKVV